MRRAPQEQPSASGKAKANGVKQQNASRVCCAAFQDGTQSLGSVLLETDWWKLSISP